MTSRSAVYDRVKDKLAELGLSATAVSLEVTDRADKDLIRDIRRRGRTPGGDTMARLARRLGTTQEWLLYGLEGADTPPTPDTVLTEVRAAGLKDRNLDWNAPAMPKMPLLGSAIGCNYGDINEHIELTELYTRDVVEWLERPEYLRDDPDGYALKVINDSMAPLFNPGVTLHISTRAAVAIGDNVIVQLTDGNDEQVRKVLIKQFVRRAVDHIELRQFNPAVTFRVPIAQIATGPNFRARIHKVVGMKF